MKNVIIISFIFIFSLFFIQDVSASVIPTSINNLTIGGQNLTTNQDLYVGPGNVNINFSLLLDSNFSSDWGKISIVVCSNGAMSGGIIPSGYGSYIRNIKHVDSQYTCTMVNGAVGKVRMLTFELLFGDAGGFDGYFTVYSPSFNLQLIDFVVDSSQYVNLFDYSSDTLITQNSQIINQNTQIINSQNETNDKLDDIIDADISAEDKEMPDDSSYQDYTDAEGDLMDKVSEADLDSLDIAIDTNSSNFVWDTITDILQSHPLIMSTIIAILSIGVIKLALGR